MRLYQVFRDHAPEPNSTASHMQLTAIKRADTQPQHRTQLYTQLAQHATWDHGTYYNIIIHYQRVQPKD